MARIRSIKPTFWTDEKLGLLPRDTRTCFLGLISAMADDHGRCVGNPRIVRGAVFPFDDDITAAHVVPMLEQLAAAGRIVRYQVNGDDYIQITHWTKHQKVDRPAPSLLPPPPEESTNDRRTLDEPSSNDRRPFPTEGEEERDRDRTPPLLPPRADDDGLERFSDPQDRDAVAGFLAAAPAAKRSAWRMRLLGYLDGLDIARGVTAADIASGLRDYGLAGHTDYGPAHVRRFVERAMAERLRPPVRAGPPDVAAQTRAAAREVSAATQALFRRPSTGTTP
jgi:hypothetical protein